MGTAVLSFVAVTLLLKSIASGMVTVNTMKYNDDNGDSFIYMKKPIAKVTDSTEASEKLIKFTRDEFLKREVMKVGDNIFVAIGWGLANSIMIEGDDGIIIVDTMENPIAMREILTEFRKITKKPVKAIILTHFHTDHITGAGAILAEENKMYPNLTIDIYAHALTEELMFGFSDTYEIGIIRGLRQVGSLLPKIEGSVTGAGLGPELRLNRDATLIIPSPTITYTNRANFTVAGVEFELIHTPGETKDQTTVWIKKQRAVLPGDNIYKTFPNLYTIRGSPSRDAKRWYQSLDRIRELHGRYIVGSHTKPIIGEEAVYNALLIYRDAIKYVHDQTLRLLNKGYTAGEIVERIQLPDNIRSHPHLQEHYGTVAWSVRGIFTNYLGWFNGNPKDLNPMTNSERAARILRLVQNAKDSSVSPAEIILREAQRSHEKSFDQHRRTGKHIVADDKWALELVDYLIEIKALDKDLAEVAKQIKISALRAIGVEEISPNGRNYYLTSALEIEAGFTPGRTKQARAFVINTSSVREVLRMLCAKVDGLKCQCKNMTIGLHFADISSSFALTLKHSVCDILQPIPPNIVLDVHLSTTTTVFKAIKAEDLHLDTQVALGNVQILKGSLDTFKTFLECFDPVNSA